MNIKSYAIALTALITLTTTACSRKVTRIDPGEQIDLSGRWNNTDSRLAAEQLTGQILTERWLEDHNKEKKERPTVIVGMITNKSHEHIDAETFTKDIEQSFVRTSTVRLVQGGEKRAAIRAERADQQTNASTTTMKQFGLERGADYMLQGNISSIVDSQKRQKVVYYQINLELTNLETNEIVWIGDKKIAKYVKN
ncbi:penicillin-binding protein activator LpoB [Gynurincola endophyticus]|uniref:penicillin-binding protein activator LpoB n=1 Tax=Gynurincola endophyticus TaxID=2479004 RepID=UPI000F8F2A2D|nr:penicillin-binding protein activator LpoB [Gynurincola endophyticus]